MGGLSGSTQVSSALIKLLEQDASKYKWIAATEGSQEAAPIELATGGDAVMAIGGFNGTDPAPTLAQFEAMVAKGEIHYYVGPGQQQLRRRHRLLGDRLLGGGPLQVADRRRRHRLQPDPGEVAAAHKRGPGHLDRVHVLLLPMGHAHWPPSAGMRARRVL